MIKVIRTKYTNNVCLVFPPDFHIHTLINCQDLNGINEKYFKIKGAAIEGDDLK